MLDQAVPVFRCGVALMRRTIGWLTWQCDHDFLLPSADFWWPWSVSMIDVCGCRWRVVHSGPASVSLRRTTASPRCHSSSVTSTAWCVTGCVGGLNHGSVVLVPVPDKHSYHAHSTERRRDEVDPGVPPGAVRGQQERGGPVQLGQPLHVLPRRGTLLRCQRRCAVTLPRSPSLGVSSCRG